MNDSNYIERVEFLLHSSEDNVEFIKKISKLQLPKNANPLITLIHGDSQQLEDATNYAQTYDPANPSSKEIADLRQELAALILQKISKYLNDWKTGNVYHYSFGIKASYGAFKNEQGEVEYIDVINSDVDASTVDEAISVAKEWESHLLERIVLYSDQKTVHKRISTKPFYIISDNQQNNIASGTLEFDDESGISTWLNQA